jgi:hypothetical protein
MEINHQRKAEEQARKQAYDLKLEQDIKSYYQELPVKKPTLHPSKYDETPAQATHIFNSKQKSSNLMLDGYDNQVKQREKNKEEWRQNLITQI